ncbi:uncharacterized protein LOC127798423 [Diospyros lotus]|uniref:uncharacterized protein LOC127798423 n=1 Tax=Diospyros lotus TaxID=55363 RepID=UPI002256FB78|nr:uncharacterized protein LOC127798423 [Diospyros lotus]
MASHSLRRQHSFFLCSRSLKRATMGGSKPEKDVLKLVHPGRQVEIHREPITAAEVMRRNPRHCVARPDVFKFPWIVKARRLDSQPSSRGNQPAKKSHDHHLAPKQASPHKSRALHGQTTKSYDHHLLDPNKSWPHKSSARQNQSPQDYDHHLPPIRTSGKDQSPENHGHRLAPKRTSLHMSQAGRSRSPEKHGHGHRPASIRRLLCVPSTTKNQAPTNHDHHLACIRASEKKQSPENSDRGLVPIRPSPHTTCAGKNPSPDQNHGRRLDPIRTSLLMSYREKNQSPVNHDDGHCLAPIRTSRKNHSPENHDSSLPLIRNSVQMASEEKNQSPENHGHHLAPIKTSGKNQSHPSPSQISPHRLCAGVTPKHQNHYRDINKQITHRSLWDGVSSEEDDSHGSCSPQPNHEQCLKKHACHSPWDEVSSEEAGDLDGSHVGQSCPEGLPEVIYKIINIYQEMKYEKPGGPTLETGSFWTKPYHGNRSITSAASAISGNHHTEIRSQEQVNVLKSCLRKHDCVCKPQNLKVTFSFPIATACGESPSFKQNF